MTLIVWSRVYSNHDLYFRYSVTLGMGSSRIKGEEFAIYDSNPNEIYEFMNKSRSNTNGDKGVKSQIFIKTKFLSNKGG